MDSEILPSYFELTIEHQASVPAAELARLYFTDVSTRGFGDVVYWKLGKFDCESSGPYLEDMAAAAEKSQSDATFRFVTDEHFQVQGALGLGGRQFWVVSCKYLEPAGAPEAPWLQRMAELARCRVSDPHFTTAVLERASLGTASFPPSPPLARTNHLIVTSEDEVARCYEDPDVFWPVWDGVESTGDNRLCVRALDEIDEPSWLARTFEDHMALARASRPGLTRYNRVFLADWMKDDWWDYGEPTLRQSGYDEQEKLLEFTCLPAPGEHVLIREIHGIRTIVGSGKSFDDRPVKRVRIVFPDEQTAQAEKRPLLDVGAEVCFLDPTGDDTPVPV